MTREEIKIDLKRVGAIVAVLGGLWLLTTAAVAMLDHRFAQASDLQRVEAKVDRILDVACDGKSHRACR